MSEETKARGDDGFKPLVYETAVRIKAVNHRGELVVRDIMPENIKFGVTDLHPDPQWFLDAMDYTRGAPRTFAMRHIIEFDRREDQLILATPRSSQWRKVRLEHLERFPECAACGRKQALEVHHVLPFHLFPEHELDYDNLVTLCEWPSLNCHLLFGHCMDWRHYNPSARGDAARNFNMIRGRL